MRENAPRLWLKWYGDLDPRAAGGGRLSLGLGDDAEEPKSVFLSPRAGETNSTGLK